MDKNHPDLVRLPQPPGSPDLLLSLAQLPEMLSQLHDKAEQESNEDFTDP